MALLSAAAPTTHRTVHIVMKGHESMYMHPASQEEEHAFECRAEEENCEASTWYAVNV